MGSRANQQLATVIVVKQVGLLRTLNEKQCHDHSQLLYDVIEMSYQRYTTKQIILTTYSIVGAV